MNNIKFFDSHAHINLQHYDNDRDEIIKKIFGSGVDKIVIPGVDMETISSALKLAEKYPDNIYTGIGFHPTDSIKWDTTTLNTLKELSKNKSVVAIGEIGLDYYWDTSPKELQHEIFITQIELAKELNLPVIIHTRDSHEDTLKILKENNAGKTGGIFHCFSGDSDFAKQCIDIGFYISFAGNITFKNAQKLRDAAKEIPLERILIETDSPYLTPMPDRGKRNDPSYVRFIAQQIADIKGLSLEEVATQTYKNALSVFKITEE